MDRFSSRSRYIEFSIFLLLIILTLLLRTASLNYLDASDNYNDIAYKALITNNQSCYNYSNITTFITLWLLKFNSFSIAILKFPPIIYSIVSSFFIYLTAKKLNNKVALFSLFLFAISPWSIVVSRMTRDYSFDAMVASIVLFFMVLVICRKSQKKITDRLIDLSCLLLITLFIYLLSKANYRSQTLIVALLPVSTMALNLFCILFATNISKAYKYLIASVLIFTATIVFFHFEYHNFTYGIRFDPFYLKIFFDTSIDSPWQWFYKLNSALFSCIIFLLFFLAIIPSIKDKIQIELLTSMYIAFLTSIFFFIFKFESHLHYSPTRYVYFIFPLYVILISNSIYTTIITISRKRNIQWLLSIAIAIIFLKLMNIQALNYAIFPQKAYAKDGRKTIYADNLGIGLFQMEEVIEYLRQELEWGYDKTFVFDGRYGEFILLLDYAIDKDRCIERDTGAFYDVGKNMFVESQYFNYHELSDAIKLNEKGFLVTKDKYLTDSKHGKIIELIEDDFLFNDEKLIFLKNINGFNIYKWI